MLPRRGLGSVLWRRGSGAMLSRPTLPGAGALPPRGPESMPPMPPPPLITFLNRLMTAVRTHAAGDDKPMTAAPHPDAPLLPLSRREFLRRSGLGCGSLALA